MADRTDRDHGLRACSLTSLLDAELDAEDVDLHVAGDGDLYTPPARPDIIESRVAREMRKAVAKGAPMSRGDVEAHVLASLERAVTRWLGARAKTTTEAERSAARERMLRVWEAEDARERERPLRRRGRR